MTASHRIMFSSVGSMPDGNGKKRPAKMFHRKSRNGCQRCRARRVKCNEAHPACENCQRHRFACIYDRDRHDSSQTTPESTSSSPSRRRLLRKSTSHNGDIVSYSNSETTVRSPPSTPSLSLTEESTSRRLLELTLLHNLHIHTASTIASDRQTHDAFITSGFTLATQPQNSALLNAIFTVSALHSLHREPTNRIYSSAYQVYLDLALQAHQHDVQILSPSNLDVVILTSSMLRICAFALLQTRELSPYEPPNLFLSMTMGTGRVFRAGAEFCGDQSGSLLSQFVDRVPFVKDNESLYGHSKTSGLTHLLDRTEEDEKTEIWTEEVREAYESTISCLGITWQEFQGKETVARLRKVIVWPMTIPDTFPALVQAREPRALVILAYYFGIMTTYKHVWWLGTCGQREVRAIAKFLFEEVGDDERHCGRWTELMSWPLQAVGGTE